MHILIIPSWYPSSYDSLLGIFFKEQAEALAKETSKVGVITIQDVGIRNILNQRKVTLGCDIFVENDVYTYRKQYIDVVRGTSIVTALKKYFFVQLLERYITEQGLPDIVHLHAFMAGEFALYIKEKYQIPYVVTEHLSAFLKKEISSKNVQKATNIYEGSSCNMAVSKHLKMMLASTFSTSFMYVPNSVNMHFFTLKAYIEKKTYNFINIAHLDSNKNQGMLIKAFHGAFKNQSHLRLTIVGNGDTYERLHALIVSLEIEEQIMLYGKASREEVKMLLHQSDAFVLSSRLETFGVVLIEAMACGLPVISTRCGGPESIIISEKFGLLCDINEKSLSKKIIEMYNKRETYHAAYIRRYVENHFSQKVVCERLKKIYEEVLK